MNAKGLLIIGAFVVVVFGITLVSQFSFTTPTTEDTSTDNTPIQPLRLIQQTNTFFDPNSEAPTQRFFPGFFEVSQEENTTSFWLQNVNPTPVDFSVVGRSCSSCTSARLALVHPDGMNAFLTRADVGLPPVALQFGAIPVPDLGSVLAAAAMLKPLKWHEFTFSGSNDMAQIPAGSPEQPTWAVFQIGIKVTGIGSKTLSANVSLHTAKMPAPVPVVFQVALVGMHPFLVTPESLNFGTVPSTGSPRTEDVVYWSATRLQANLPPPVTAVDNAEGFIAVSPPVPLTEAERTTLFEKLVEQGRQAPILGAYKLGVTVLPHAPAGQTVPLPDIGPFERTIGVTGPGTATARVSVKGTIAGLVELASGNDLKLGRYNGTTGTSKTVTLISDLPTLELETIPREIRPDTLKVELEPLKSDDGRKRWSLKVVVPPGAGIGDMPADSAIVLRSQGPKSQRIRIPVQGSAGLR